MSALRLLLVAGLLSVCAASTYPYQEKYFDQTIDHFNPRSFSKTFKHRYLVNSDYFSNESGPIFVYTGNEGAIEGFWDNSGLVFELAEQFHAYVVFPEHRYYGKSLPFGDDSFTPENMQFLTVENALADYAVLLTWLKEQLGQRPVVAFGGSYGGMLTAYMRFKYPNVVDAGLASSAPIFPMKPGDFYRGATDDCAKANPQCPVVARQAFVKLLSLTKSEAGLAEITKTFQLCSPLTADRVDHLLGWIRNSFAMMAMVDYPYAASFLAPLPAFPIKVACQRITEAADSLAGLASATGLFYHGTSSKSECYNITAEYIECADPTGCGTGPAALSWDYQVCSELQLPSDTNNITDMFPPSPWDPEKIAAYCMKRWGVTPQNAWNHIQFWNTRINAASKIIFSNGELDPWHFGGVLDPVKGAPTLVPLMIKGAAHHLDLRGSHPGDSEELVAARKLEADLIKQWISEV